MSDLKKLVTVRCVENHEFELGDPQGKIARTGYLPCPQMGCLRNGFVVDLLDYLYSDAVKELPATEDDMQHLDEVGEICDKCGQAINQRVGFMGNLKKDRRHHD